MPPIYASVECCPPLRGRRGFPFKGERREGKHVRKGEIAIQFTRTFACAKIVATIFAQNRNFTPPIGKWSIPFLPCHSEGTQ